MADQWDPAPPVGWEGPLEAAAPDRDFAIRFLLHLCKSKNTDEHDVVNVVLGRKPIAHWSEESDGFQKTLCRAVLKCGMRSLPEACVVYHPKQWTRAYVYAALMHAPVPPHPAVTELMATTDFWDLSTIECVLLGYSLTSRAIWDTSDTYWEWVEETQFTAQENCWTVEEYVNGLLEEEAVKLYARFTDFAVDYISSRATAWSKAEAAITSIVAEVSKCKDLLLFMRGFP